MSERLGEYLVKAGKITERQLSLVLERQVTMGGRLGTNLIEMGCLTENELTQFLSKKLMIPSVKAEDLENIDPALFRLIPRDMAQKYHVVPIKRERNTLSVALLDPTDFEVIAELRFITGYVIKPYVTSEARIQFAMERYYEVNRQLRYVSILDDERKKQEVIMVGEAEESERKAPTEAELEETLKQAKEDWVEVRDRDEAIGIFLKAASVVLNRGVLFLVKAGTASAWKTFPTHHEAEITGLEFKLEEASLMREVVSAKTFYRGVPPSPSDHLVPQTIFQALGGSPPAEILLFPILIKDQVVAILYGDSSFSGSLETAVAFIRKLAPKVSMALEILILKKKILEL